MKENQTRGFPLTLSQQDIYFDQLRHPDCPLYNIGGVIRLAKIDEARIIEAHAKLISEHDVFGIRIHHGNNEPSQTIVSDRNRLLKLIDFSDKVSPASEAEQWLKSLFTTSVEIENVELFKSYLLKLSAESYLYLGFAHHLIMDGWGFSNWARSLAEYYDQVTITSMASRSWQEVVVSDIDYLNSQLYLKHQDYWRKKLELLPEPILQQCHKEKFKHNKAMPSKRLSVNISNQLHRKLLSLAKNKSWSVAQVYMAVVCIYFAKINDQAEFMIGLPAHNRRTAKDKNKIGLFTSLSPIKVKVDLDSTFSDLCLRLALETKESYRYQRFPIGHIKRVANSHHSNNLFDIGFNYLNLDTHLTFAESNAELVYLSHSYEQTPLMVNVWELGVNGGVEIQFDHNLSYISSLEMNLIKDRFIAILEQVASSEVDNLSNVELISQKERQQIQKFSKIKQVSYQNDRCIHELFEEQVVEHANQVALVFEDKKLTYQKLNQQANQLAHYLIEQYGCLANIPIGLCMTRSSEMIVGMLAILKAGGAYVPIEPDLPQVRINYILDDANLNLVLTLNALSSKFETCRSDFLCIDELAFQNYPMTNLNRKELDLSSSNLAYVIYTSGSTGNPKGVECLHSAVINLISDFFSRGKIGVGKAGSMWTNFAFDVSVYEIFSVLFSGAALHIVPDKVRLEPHDFFKWLELNRINTGYIPPFYLSEFQQKIENKQVTSYLERLLVGVEPISKHVLINLMENIQKLQIINGYGPSETTICCTLYDVSIDTLKSDSNITPIGRPVINTELHLLDSMQSIVPLGCVGELYVGGAGLAKGYLNNPLLTAEKFIDNPYFDRENIHSSKLLYKTGDLVRYLADGDLEFIGRIDQQVKINGFRIEIGEVEFQLSQCEAVDSAQVLVKEDNFGGKQLVGYIKIDLTHATREQEKLILTKIKATLKMRLPRYMVPNAFLFVDHWPININGKIDKKALAKLDIKLLQSEYIAAKSGTEKVLVEIWSKLLSLDPQQISCGADFFELGGHSLLAVRLISEIRQRLSVELSVKDIFDSATIITLSDLIEKSAESKNSPIIEALGQEKANLSFAQQRLWFIDKLNGNSLEYNMPVAFNVTGTFDPQIGKQAFVNIIQRHQVLRTVYIEKAGVVSQKVNETFEFFLATYDLTAISTAEQQAQLSNYIQSDENKPFNLSTDLMLRASFVKLTDEKGVLLFNMHHIASDGWSVKILMQEFAHLYQALVEGKSTSLPELNIQYADYAHWQNNWLQGEVLEKQLGYWQKQLSNAPPVHSLMLDLPRPTEKKYKGASVLGVLSGEVAESLKSVAASYKLTPFMLLHAALCLLISRHSNNKDILVGTPVANRMKAELEPLIGFFVNTLVLRLDTNHDQLKDYLAHVRQVHLDAQSNQDVPFEQLVERLKIPYSETITPLFQIMLTINSDYGVKLDGLVKVDLDARDLPLEAIQKKSSELDFSLHGLTFAALAPDDVSIKFDLEIDINFNDNGVFVDWIYDKSLFTKSHVEQLNKHFCCLLTGLSALSHSALETPLKINDLPMLSLDEMEYQLDTLSQAPLDYSSESCIHELFEAQVLDHGDKVAVIFEEQELTYKALNRRANQVAHYLIENYRIQPDMLIGICVARSLDMAVGILAILKAGGAYVPLDPEYPQARIDYILEDAGLELVLTQNELVSKFDSSHCKKVVLDSDLFENYPIFNIDKNSIGLTSSHLAYMLYTSGSTGQPKGVMIEHVNLLNYDLHIKQRYKISDTDCVLQFSTVNFDIFVEEFFGALSNGAKLVLMGEWSGLDTRSLIEFCNFHRVNVVSLPTAFWHQLNASDIANKTELRLVVLGGEALQRHLVELWLEHCSEIELINSYGPTECTVTATSYQIKKDLPLCQGVPIGKVNSNGKILVLDDSLRLVPLGAIGELYVGGAGVARGYFNRAELTEKCFIQDPFRKGSQTCIYKTGDLVRYLPDGNLEFIGRVDDQVKIRGFRIELAEIEHQIMQNDRVAACVVVTREKDFNNKYIVAYLVPSALSKLLDKSQFIEAVRENIQRELPDYMRPSAWVVLDGIPLTINGKVDKKALPEPDFTLLQKDYVAPSTEVEHQLVDIWAGLLNLDPLKISVMSNFFELGGHSLLTIRLVSEIRQRFSVELPIKAIFESSTVFSIADIITQKSLMDIVVKREADSIIKVQGIL